MEFSPDAGKVIFENGVATMTAHPESLEVRVEAGDAEGVDRMKGVLARHLDRFAFREAPLSFVWSDQA